MSIAYYGDIPDFVWDGRQIERESDQEYAPDTGVRAYREYLGYGYSGIDRQGGGSIFMPRASTNAISPCFIVSDVDQTIAFYCDKLGFETRFRAPDEAPFFAIIGREGAQIFVKSDKDVSPLPNHRRHHYMRWDSFVYAPDPDALAAEFADHGASFSAPLEDTHDGLRGFEISDPDGYILFFGRPKE